MVTYKILCFVVYVYKKINSRRYTKIEIVYRNCMEKCGFEASETDKKMTELS